MTGALSNMRRYTHIAAAFDYLRHCGADEIEIVQRKRVRVAWRHEGERLSISLPVAGRKASASAALQAVRRPYREAGVVVAA